MFDRVNNQGHAIVKRGHVANRHARRAAEHAFAADVIGNLSPGVELVAVSAGRFSMASVLLHILGQTGPADVVVCVPGVAAADLGVVETLRMSGLVRTLRMLVDFQVAARQLPLVRLVQQAFGSDAVNVGHIHAGFVVVRNHRWSVAVRSSAALAAARRVELFEVSDDTTLADFLLEVFDRMSTNAPAVDASRLAHDEHLERVFPRAVGPQPPPVVGGVDPRRRGVSYR